MRDTSNKLARPHVPIMISIVAAVFAAEKWPIIGWQIVSQWKEQIVLIWIDSDMCGPAAVLKGEASVTGRDQHITEKMYDGRSVGKCCSAFVDIAELGNHLRGPRKRWA